MARPAYERFIPIRDPAAADGLPLRTEYSAVMRKKSSGTLEIAAELWYNDGIWIFAPA